MAWDTRSRHARGYGYAWVKLRDEIIERDCGLCQGCARKGRVAVGKEVHHKTPRALGGKDTHENLELLCTDCHELADAAALGKSTARRYRVALDGTLIDEPGGGRFDLG